MGIELLPLEHWGARHNEYHAKQKPDVRREFGGIPKFCVFEFGQLVTQCRIRELLRQLSCPGESAW
jgi:hypothetical protein